LSAYVIKICKSLSFSIASTHGGHLSEPAHTNTPPWMDSEWTGHVFPMGSCAPANLPIAEGSKRVPKVLKYQA